MIELTLSKIKVDEKRHEQLVVFREVSGKRFLPLVIGLPETQAIKMKLSGVKIPRPMTHDLMLSVVEGLGGKVQKIVIDKLENNTFYAKLHLRRGDGTEAVIDARPSDSVAIALRAQVPVFVEETVLDQASVYDV